MLTVLVIIFLCLYVFYRIGGDMLNELDTTLELIHAKWERAVALHLLYRQSEAIVLTAPVMAATLEPTVVEDMKNNSIKTMDMCRYQMLELGKDLKELAKWSFLQRLLFVKKDVRITVNQMVQEVENYWIRMNIDLD